MVFTLLFTAIVFWFARLYLRTLLRSELKHKLSRESLVRSIMHDAVDDIHDTADDEDYTMDNNNNENNHNSNNKNNGSGISGSNSSKLFYAAVCCFCCTKFKRITYCLRHLWRTITSTSKLKFAVTWWCYRYFYFIYACFNLVYMMVLVAISLSMASYLDQQRYLRIGFISIVVIVTSFIVAISMLFRVVFYFVFEHFFLNFNVF